ncbi:hypothetical protein [Pseudomonas sp. D3-10]|uniref:hypothetical protein n=1 Tax=Pseudomonas sp. D3-10 TaxID=2817392 RepID=UPI003DAA47FF
MSNNIPLSPCPFCGCTVQAITGFDYVRIKGDHAGSCVFVDDDPIIADAAEWNIRAALAEVAEVTQGQREPVAYRCRHSASEPWFFSDKPGYWEWQPLYTEQPAPVAVVMPELDDHDRSGQNYWADQAAQGRPYEQQLREACERNGIDPGLDDE